MKPDIIERFRVTPENTCLETLSPREISALFEESRADIHDTLERCALAVLNAGLETDDVKSMMERYQDFRLEVIKTAGGIEIDLFNAPAEAFVTYEPRSGGKIKIIEGMRRHIFAVLRDLVFVKTEIERTGKFDLGTPGGITDSIFLILRNAGIFEKRGRHKVAVCWGGHAISSEEYEYSKEVGYECGLRLMDIITGCGPGAMKGPMKGAAIAHAKQRVEGGRYIGITEPGIIASEAPNAIVNPLVIMPDIEKRLEAFVRMGHGIVIFPGGAGTAEEIMYILGILSHPDNHGDPFPIIMTGPESSREFFENIDRFLRRTLGGEVTARCRVIVGDARRVAIELNNGLLQVKGRREDTGDSYYFNRGLFIPPMFQEEFAPSHEAAGRLEVARESEAWLFAASLRRVFSAVVWGNVKPEGVRAVEEKGPLEISGDRDVMEEVDALLEYFARAKRMRLAGEYKPCYKIVS